MLCRVFLPVIKKVNCTKYLKYQILPDYVLFRDRGYSTMEYANKRIKRSEKEIRIGTHNGIFHCDEVLACFMLKQIPMFSNATILRTRDETKLGECDIVVDVGGVFNKETLRFDHHQKTFTDTMSSVCPQIGSSFDVRLSSAGLVYAFFGKQVIKESLLKKNGTKLNENALNSIFIKLYENLIREIDGIDNGVPMFDGEPKYQISTHLSARVANYNPTWNEKCTETEIYQRFEKAMKYVGEEFLDKLFYYVESWWPARTIVSKAICNRLNIHKSGEILELETPCPWKEHLFSLEEEVKIKGIPKYVIMQNAENDWRVICVPNTPSSFVCRKFLHKDWRGLRGGDITDLSDIQDAIFCHATGFIGGCRSREGALRMAVLSLEGEYVD